MLINIPSTASNPCMSHSMFIENKSISSNPLTYTPLPKISYTWQSNQGVTSCNLCKYQFNIWIRKHHCRLCGKIFCHTCSSSNMVIPNTLTYSDIHKNTPQRVCDNCNTIIERINYIQIIADSLNMMDIDLLMLHKISHMRGEKVHWSHAANYLLTIFKNTQYKTPFYKLDDVEKKLLWRNVHLFRHHNRYMTVLYSSCVTDEEVIKLDLLLSLNGEKVEKVCSCDTLMCTRTCNPTFTITDALCICNAIFEEGGHNLDMLKNKVVNILRDIDDDTLNTSIHTLAYYVSLDSSDILSDYLMERCIINTVLSNNYQWFIRKTHPFIPIMRKLYENMRNNIPTKDITIEEPGLPHPSNPNIRIKTILCSQAIMKSSASNPMIVSCVTFDNEVTHFMYKKDNICKDVIVMNIIKYMSDIVNKAMDIELDVVMYNVYPFSDWDGLIDIVDDADTVYHIECNEKHSIFNYMVERNIDIKVGDVRKRYIKSAALYSVITYLLGIGDRHLDNIMITKDARLFHIDFDYMLGKGCIFANGDGIRITKEMIDVIGGENSEGYNTFVSLCSDIYNITRLHMNLFITMLDMIPSVDKDITREMIRKHCFETFLPGESSISARFRITQKIENKNLSYIIKDWVYYHKKEHITHSDITTFMTSLWG